jgi:formate dehydrogenase alpha subunit
LSCDKSGVCGLQRYAYELGVEKSSFPVRDPGYPVDDSNPFIVRNYNLCILCGRCIRVCRIQGSDVLDFVKRGIETRVATALDKPLLEAGCDFCGSCVNVCPTGALVEKSRRGKGREWEFTAQSSSCGYCSSACELHYKVKNGDVVAVTTTKPADYLCARGRFGHDYLLDEARLATPLLRRGGKLVPADWEEALEYTAARLKDIGGRFGPGAVGGIIGALSTNETAYLFQKFFRAGLKTNNVDSVLRLTGLDFMRKVDAIVGGSRGLAGLDDIARAKVILVIGDVWRRVPSVWGPIKRAADRGAKVVYIGYYAGRPAKIAKAWLRALPGAEHIVLQQMARTVLKTGEAKFPEDKVSGFGKFSKTVKQSVNTPTGVVAEEIAAAAALWADKQAKGVAVLAVDGVNEDTANMALNLCLLTGRLRALFAGHSLSNAQGVWRMGAAVELLPGMQPVDRARTKFAKLWDTPLPNAGGLTVSQMLTENSPIKALYVLGDDPATSFPGCGQVAARLKKMEFLVVQDLFLTETAKMADVVLPLASPLETGGTCVNMEGRVRQFGKVFPTKTLDFRQVIGQLASKLNFSLAYTSFRHVEQEIRTVAPNFGLVASAPPRPAFLTLSGHGPQVEAFDTLLLAPFATRFGFYDKYRVEKSGFGDLLPYGGNFVGVSPADSERLGLGDGVPVTVETVFGKVQSTVITDAGLAAGVIIMPAYAAATNAVFGSEARQGPVAAVLTKV